MGLKENYNRFIRYGLILIGLAGFIFAIGDALIPQEGDMFNAAGDPEGFAELVTTDNFRLWAARGLIGVPLEVIGTIALFLGLAGTFREKLAFWGMLLCILGDLFGVSIFMFAYFVFPEAGQLILEGIIAASSVADVSRLMPVFGAGFLITFIGLILFAAAIWKAEERFPKWSGIVVVIGFVLLLIQTSYVIQILANVLWGSAYLWMAAYSWHRFSNE
ncbi:hypothetical protein ACG2F4_09730 [Halalkalibaculum sp. DA3122]|uniref:hypothetical protein n=1 Tax=Halalkalibaculum sp. DA3122 TaxID=3373607 RepID=UPI0037547EDE